MRFFGLLNESRGKMTMKAQKILIQTALGLYCALSQFKFR